MLHIASRFCFAKFNFLDFRKNKFNSVLEEVQYSEIYKSCYNDTNLIISTFKNISHVDIWYRVVPLSKIEAHVILSFEEVLKFYPEYVDVVYMYRQKNTIINENTPRQIINYLFFDNIVDNAMYEHILRGIRFDKSNYDVVTCGVLEWVDFKLRLSDKIRLTSLYKILRICKDFINNLYAYRRVDIEQIQALDFTYQNITDHSLHYYVDMIRIYRDHYNDDEMRAVMKTIDASRRQRIRRLLN